MHKTIVETSSKHPSKEGGRLLARVLAEDLLRVHGGQGLGSPVTAVVTGAVKRDWSDPELETPPSF